MIVLILSGAVSTIKGRWMQGLLFSLPLRIYLGPVLGKHMHAHHPYPHLSAELSRRFPQARILITGDRLVAGNLYFQRPELRTLLLDEVVDGHTLAEGEVLLVVRGGTDAGWLERFRAAYPGSVVPEHGRLDLPYRYGSTKTMSFDYARVFIGNRP